MSRKERILSVLLPVSILAVVFFFLMAAILVTEAQTDRPGSFFIYDISTNGRFYNPTRASYIIFSLGFVFTSLIFAMLGGYRYYKIRAMTDLKLSLIAELVLVTIVSVMLIVMTFSNGLVSALHTTTAMIAWLAFVVYSVLHALILVYVIKRTENITRWVWYLIPAALIISSVVSFVFVILYVSIDNSIFEWIAFFFLGVHFTAAVFEMFLYP